MALRISLTKGGLLARKSDLASDGTIRQTDNGVNAYRVLVECNVPRSLIPEIMFLTVDRDDG